MLAPIQLRTTRSYELQQEPSKKLSVASSRWGLSPPRGYHSVSHGGRHSSLSPLGTNAKARTTSLSQLSPLESSAKARTSGSFEFDKNTHLATTTPQSQRVSRRYFFRGLEHRTGFPAAGHYDVIVPPVSDPGTHHDQPGNRRSFNYVDTLVNAVASGNYGECDTTRICAEDLAMFICDTRPFAAPDSRPMFMLARDLLKALVSDKLDIVSREGEALEAAMAVLEREKGELESQLADQTTGVKAKLRRIESKLEKERASALDIRTERDVLAKEVKRVQRRLQQYEPEEHKLKGRLRATTMIMSGMHNHMPASGDVAANRREVILADPARLHSAAALIDVLSQEDRWRLLRVAWDSFECLPTAALEHAQAAVGHAPIYQHCAETQVDLKLFVRSKTDAEKREVIDDLAAKLGLNDNTLRSLVKPYPALLGDGERHVSSDGDGILANAVVQCLDDADGGVQPTCKTTAIVLSLFYRLPGEIGEASLEHVRAVSQFGLCVGEPRRRRVLELLRGAVLPDPLPQEPDQLSAAEQQILYAQLLVQYGVATNEFADAVAAAAVQSGTDQLPESMLALVGLNDASDRRRKMEAIVRVVDAVAASAALQPGADQLPESMVDLLGPDVNDRGSKLASIVRSELYHNSSLNLVAMATQTDPMGKSDDSCDLIEQLRRGELSAEELKTVGVALFEQATAADAQQLRELLEGFMCDERVGTIIKAIVLEHEMAAEAAKAANHQSQQEQVLNADTDAVEVQQQSDCQSKPKKGLLAISMTSAFGSAHAKQKSKRLERNAKKLKQFVSNASNIKLMQMISADAHARDFTVKEWHKRTKNWTGTDLFNDLWPPVPNYPCEKPMKIASINKLISKIYEQLCAEFYAGTQRASRVSERTRPPLVQYVEDSLLLQYGMPSLARKTLLQMVATCHKHHEIQPRCRTFAELSGIIPPRWDMLALCRDPAEDFYFRTLVDIYPSARKGKLADNMCSVRTSSIGIDEAHDRARGLYPAEIDGRLELELEMRNQLVALSHETKQGDTVVSIDQYLDYMLSKWCGMVEAQRQQLLALFSSVDDGDGQLTLAEFTRVVEMVTPAASQAEVLELYRRCLAQSAEVREAAACGTEQDDDGSDIDAIEPEAFLAVMLPQLLQIMQN